MRFKLVLQLGLFLVTAGGLTLGFQNCSKVQLDEEALELSLSSQSCPSDIISCEDDSGTGTQSCEMAESIRSVGECIIDSCKEGFNLVNGTCVSECTPNQTMTCRYGAGSGSRTCSAQGTWSSCENVMCDEGNYPYAQAGGICVPGIVELRLNGQSTMNWSAKPTSVSVSIEEFPVNYFSASNSYWEYVSGQCPAKNTYFGASTKIKMTSDFTTAGPTFAKGTLQWLISDAVYNEIAGCTLKMCAVSTDSTVENCNMIIVAARPVVTTTTSSTTTTSRPTVTTTTTSSTTTTTIPKTNIGNLETVTRGSQGELLITGWACTTGVTNSVYVQVYAGVPGETQSILLMSQLANIANEPAVTTACKAAGNHRFSISLSMSQSQPHVGKPVYVVASLDATVPAMSITGSGQKTIPNHTCPAGQHAETNGCVSNTRTCAVTNGSGTQTWNGTAWGACSGITCNAGFVKSGEQCVAPTPTTTTTSTTTSTTRPPVATTTTTSSTTTTTIPRVNIGNLETVTRGSQGELLITGWACTTGVTTSVRVQVYTGVPGETQSILLINQAADIANEPAVTTACKAAGNHRFSVNIPISQAQPHVGKPVYVVASLDATVPAMSITGSGQKTIPNHTCPAGQHMESNGCYANTRNCAIQNGRATQTWNGTSYGACSEVVCDAGYQKSKNFCLSPAPTTIAGFYITPCTQNGTYGNQTRYTRAMNEFKADGTQYLHFMVFTNPTCTGAVQITRTTTNYKINGYSQTEVGGYEIDFTFRSESYAIYTAAAVTQYNQQKACGVSNWRYGVENTFTTGDCGPYYPSLKALNLIEANRLYTGLYGAVFDAQVRPVEVNRTAAAIQTKAAFCAIANGRGYLSEATGDTTCKVLNCNEGYTVGPNAQSCIR